MKPSPALARIFGLLALSACSAATTASPQAASAIDAASVVRAERAKSPTKVETASADETFDRRSVPDECAKSSESCQPSRDFVSRLCTAKNPSIAVAMFGGQTPWKRAYVRVQEIEAINTAGGPSGEENLIFDEEVIVLNRRPARQTEMSVSGADGYLVLRWDGTCSTVQSDEMTDRVPPKALHAPIAFNYLDDDLQTALLADAKIRDLRRAQRSACGGRTLAPDQRCRDANRKLGDRIVAALHGGLQLQSESTAVLDVARDESKRGIGVASR
jgi:hypothetical protein